MQMQCDRLLSHRGPQPLDLGLSGLELGLLGTLAATFHGVLCPLCALRGAGVPRQ